MLTSAQIDVLFDFCKKHFVQHFDVQVELVDHLANAIEDKMAAKPGLSFENALQQVYAGFGTMGFAGVVSAKSASLEKASRKIRWKLFLSYFTVPKIAMTACFLIAFSMLPSFVPWKYVNYTFPFAWVVLLMVELYFFVMANRLSKQQKQKLLLTGTNMYGPYFSIGCLFPWLGFEVSGIYSGRALVFYEINVLLGIIAFVSMLAWREHVQATYKIARQQYPAAFVSPGQ